jgi:hypothetical protein
MTITTLASVVTIEPSVSQMLAPGRHEKLQTEPIDGHEREPGDTDLTQTNLEPKNPYIPGCENAIVEHLAATVPRVSSA